MLDCIETSLVQPHVLTVSYYTPCCLSIALYDKLQTKSQRTGRHFCNKDGHVAFSAFGSLRKQP